MTIVIDHVDAPPCTREPAFLDERLHDWSDAATRDRGRRARAELGPVIAAARRGCASCPMLVDCLYRAVVEVDVSGFVACTTETERAALRDSLGISVDAGPQGLYGAVRLGVGPVDHEAVLAARRAHPKDTCQQLAERLGCSTSTIKRHLRRARAAAASAQDTPSAIRTTPSVDDVLDAFDALEATRVA